MSTAGSPPMVDPRPDPIWRWALMLACVYFVLALGSILVARQDTVVATLWYANGATLAMLLARGPAARWWALAAVGLANALANLVGGSTLLQAVLFVPPNLMEIAIASLLLQRWRRGIDLPEVHQDVFALLRSLLLGVALPALVSAPLGALLLSRYAAGPLAALTLDWYIATLIGGWAVWPVAWRLATLGPRRFFQALNLESAAWYLLSLGVTLLAQTRLPYPFIYIAMPLSMLALRQGFDATALGVLMCSVLMGLLASTGLSALPPIVAYWELLLFYLPMVLSLMPPLLLAAMTDGKQRVTAALAESERNYRDLYRRSPVMLHSIDGDGRIVSVSDLWLTKLGYRPEEVLGRRSTDFLSEASRDYALRVVLPTFMRERHVEGIPYQWRRKNGEMLDGLVSAVAEQDANGNFKRSLAVIEDVTERNRLAAALAASELFEVTLHAIGDGVISTDANGRIDLLNPVAEQLLGIRRQVALGREFDAVVRLVDSRSGEALPSPVQQCLSTRQRVDLPEHAELLTAAGRRYAVQTTVSPILAKDGELIGAVLVMQDVSASRALAERMHYLAQHDALTDLPNRLLLRDRIAQRCERARREGDAFAVLMFDLDRFKEVNDTLGHAAGDELLRLLAQRARQAVRSSDTVCRLGGDEFLVLLDKINGPQSVLEVAAKLLQTLGQSAPLPQGRVEPMASIGIALYPEHGLDEQSLLGHADAALYRAKREGGMRLHLYSPELDSTSAERHRAERELARAFDEQRFELHFQPVLASEGQSVRGVEAMLRLRGTSGELLEPQHFLATAESSQLIRPLGAWALRRACEQHRAWRDQGLSIGRMAVNISAAQLDDKRFIRQLRSVLRDSGLPAAQLELGLHEATLVRESPVQRRNLALLRRLGVRLALAHFGSGLSSLGQLKQLAVDTIKIDRSFVQGLARDAADQHIVLAICSLAAGLGLRVVADGVETQGQMQRLRELGSPELQGPLLCRPLPADELTPWLQRH